MNALSLLTCATALLTMSLHATAEQVPAEVAERIAQALPDKPFATPAKPRKLLVFTKTNGYRHASIPTGKLALTELGKKTGAYEATVTEELDEFEADKLKQYDAICFLSTTMDVFSPHPEEVKKMTEAQKAEAATREARLKDNLMKFIKSGHGYIGIHAATDCCYEWAEYGKMVGGVFNGHPWYADTMVSIKVEPGQEKHPLVAMFDGQNMDFKEEIYQFKEPYDSKAVHMLLRVDVDKTDMKRPGIKRTDGDFGVAWARHWEKGRVFYCSLGHNHEMYWNPKILRHYLAGIQWAIGDYKVEIEDGK